MPAGGGFAVIIAPPMIKSLIFDFDGLILDTETPEVEVWKSIYAEYGFDFPLELWAPMIGGYGAAHFDAALHLHDLTGDSLDVQALRERHQRESNAHVLRQPVREGVREYLEAARQANLPMGIASSSAHAWVEPHLTRLGLIHYFGRIVCSEDVPAGRTKPHPDLFLKALEALKVEAGEAIVFEDSPNGVKAARAANIFVVAVPNPLTSRLSLADANLRLNSLADLPLQALLDRVA